MRWNVVTVSVASLLLQLDGFTPSTIAGVPIAGYVQPVLHLVFLLSTSVILTEVLKEASMHKGRILSFGRLAHPRTGAAEPAGAARPEAPPSPPQPSVGMASTSTGDGEPKKGVGRLSEEQAGILA